MKIIKTNPSAPEAILLMDELSKYLESITGSSGKISFNLNDISVPRSLFAVAYNDNGEAIGCGAIRPINENTAEVKRMYAREKEMGTGSAILNYLEIEAAKLGYSKLWLETRLVNNQAVSFYAKNGYHSIPNYGKYANNIEAICFEKNIQ